MATTRFDKQIILRYFVVLCVCDPSVFLFIPVDPFRLNAVIIVISTLIFLFFFCCWAYNGAAETYVDAAYREWTMSTFGTYDWTYLCTTNKWSRK